MLHQLRRHLSLRLPGRFPSGGNNSSSARHKAIWIKHRRKPKWKHLPCSLIPPYKALIATSQRKGMFQQPWKALHPRNCPNTRSATYGHFPSALIISRQMCGSFSQFWNLVNLASIGGLYLHRACSFSLWNAHIANPQSNPYPCMIIYSKATTENIWVV